MRIGEINRVLAVQNPACSRPEKAAAVVGWLMDSPWRDRLEVVQTQRPSETDNVQLIQNNLQAGDVVLSLGGDGLANDVFNAVQQAYETGQVGDDEVRILPCPTGNGNDFSRSLYGGNILRGKRLRNLLEAPVTARLDGMEINASDGFRKHAHSYVSVGFTGLSADNINLPDYRQRRRERGPLVWAKMLDAKQILKALDAPPFEYQNGSVETVEAREILLALMPRFAAGVIRLDTEPFDRKVVALELGSQAFVFKALAAISRPWLSGRANGQPLEIKDQHKLTFFTDTHMQYDGEPHALPAGSRISISHHRGIVPAVV